MSRDSNRISWSVLLVSMTLLAAPPPASADLVTYFIAPTAGTSGTTGEFWFTLSGIIPAFPHPESNVSASLTCEIAPGATSATECAILGPGSLTDISGDGFPGSQFTSLRFASAESVIFEEHSPIGPTTFQNVWDFKFGGTIPSLFQETVVYTLQVFLGTPTLVSPPLTPLPLSQSAYDAAVSDPVNQVLAFLSFTLSGTNWLAVNSGPSVTVVNHSVTDCSTAPDGTVCRVSAGACDVAETCSGGVCPADAKSTAECRASAGACDVAESCDGLNNNCPADAKSTAECRASGGVCDVAESCTGTGNDCPADSFVVAGTECRASAGACDLAESCSGNSASCPGDTFKPSTFECRAAAGACDVAESCTGVSANCPADAKSTAECRASAGVCDVAESCDGLNNNCPADAKSTAVCRASAGVCDPAESCNGVSNDCPANAFVSAGTVCRATAGVCDLSEACDGTSANCPADAFVSSSTVCRQSSGACDVEELCTGTGADCPADVSAAAGTLCFDHFKCYDAETAKRTAKFEPRNVLLADQFETKLMRVLKPESMCNPVDKNNEGIIDPTAHLACYKIKDVKTRPRQPKLVRQNVLVENQFGAQTLTVSKPESLCVPSEKNLAPSELNLDHFKCYRAKVAENTAEFQPRDVLLTDQFETKLTRVTKPVSMCNPVDKNGEGLIDAAAHLTCYKIKDTETKPRQPRFARRDVTIRNQFGDLTLAVVEADVLCLPSFKTPLGPTPRDDREDERNDDDDDDDEDEDRD